MGINLVIISREHNAFCRYVVPAARARQFETAVQQHHGTTAVASLTAKHVYCALPLPQLQQLGVRRFLQMPGCAVLTYPVSKVAIMAVRTVQVLQFCRIPALLELLRLDAVLRC